MRGIDSRVVSSCTGTESHQLCVLRSTQRFSPSPKPKRLPVSAPIPWSRCLDFGPWVWDRRGVIGTSTGSRRQATPTTGRSSERTDANSRSIALVIKCTEILWQFYQSGLGTESLPCAGSWSTGQHGRFVKQMRQAFEFLLWAVELLRSTEYVSGSR